MNAIVNKLLLAGDTFMPEMDWRPPGFTYSACGPFTKDRKNKKTLRNRKFMIYLSKPTR